jgi:hypothetical protein
VLCWSPTPGSAEYVDMLIPTKISGLAKASVHIIVDITQVRGESSSACRWGMVEDENDG